MSINQLQNFLFQKNNVRTCEMSQEPWFVASDICECLEIKDHKQAISTLEDYQIGFISMDVSSSNGVIQRRDVTAVNESGLYTLIFKSRKASAKTFQRWVTCEVLPSIRKTGGYGKAKAKNADITQWTRMVKMYQDCKSQALRNEYKKIIEFFCNDRGLDLPNFEALAKTKGDLLD